MKLKQAILYTASHNAHPTFDFALIIFNLINEVFHFSQNFLNTSTHTPLVPHP